MGIFQKLGLKRSDDSDDNSFSDGFGGMDSDNDHDPYKNDINYPTGLEDDLSASHQNDFGRAPQGIDNQDRFDPSRGFREREMPANHAAAQTSGNPQSMEVLNKNIEVLSAKVDIVRSELENMSNRLKNMENYEKEKHSPINERISHSMQKRYNQW